MRNDPEICWQSAKSENTAAKLKWKTDGCNRKFKTNNKEEWKLRLMIEKMN